MSGGSIVKVQQAENTQHTLVVIGDKKEKRCQLCRMMNCKTKAGWDILTRYKCQQCELPLCSGINSGRNCFANFHQQLLPLPAQFFQ